MIKITDVQPVSIGVKNGVSNFVKYIHRNKPLPQSETFKFYTTKDDQEFAAIKIYQGEEEELSNKHVLLGEFNLHGLPKGPARTVLISVTLSVDENGILKVNASCEGADAEKELTIDVQKVMSSEEIIEARKEQKEKLKKGKR